MRGLALVVLLACTARAEDTVRASDFGFDPVDATAALQAALDSGVATVIVDNRGADWVTRPLIIRRDNLRVVFEPGVVVTAKAGAFPGTSDSLITARGRSNLVFSGYGATLRMQKAEYTTGEWRMVLNLLSCSHVLIEGLVLRDSGGDGIYLGNAGGSAQPYCLDVHIRDVTCDNNRRQGISVISARDLLIEGSLLKNTNGTAPQAGIDLEPNRATEHLVNCVVRDTRIENNAGACMAVATLNQDATSPPLDVTFENIYCTSRGASSAITYSGVGPASGQAEFRDVLVDGFRSTGVSGYRKAAYGAAEYRFTNATFRNIGSLPLYFSGTDAGVSEYGGVRFSGTVVHLDRNTSFLSTAEAAGSQGVANLAGDITVFNPYGAQMRLGAKAHDIHLEVRERRQSVASTVSVAATATGFRITRASEDLSFPLAVTYEMAGTAVNRQDYAGLPGVAVIPAGETAVNVTLRTRRRACDALDVTLTLQESAFYTLSGDSRAETPLPLPSDCRAWARARSGK